MNRVVGRWPAFWTGLLLLGIYLLTTGGQPFISDGEVMLITAIRLVDQRTMALAERAGLYAQTVRRDDGAVFSRYGLGQPLAAAPLYAVGRYGLGKHVLHAWDEYAFGRFCALLLPATATAATGGLLGAWAARLYRSTRTGIALAVLYGVGTLAWPYSRFFFSEPLFTLCLVAAGLAIYRQRPLLSGLALGFAVSTRIGGAVVAPAFVLYALLNGRRRQDLAWMALGGVPGGALVLANNWIRFHALTEQAYGDQRFTGNLLVGLYGLLLSPGKSVFLYTPLLAALPFAARPFAHRFPTETALIGTITVVTLAQSALWWAWWGGWSWGPRFLVPLMPFLVLPLGILVRRRVWRWVIGLALFPLSVAVNLLGILVDFNDYFADLGADEARSFYEPASSPIVAHLRRLDPHHIPIVSFALDRPEVGLTEPWATLLSASFVALTLLAAAGLLTAQRGGRWR